MADFTFPTTIIPDFIEVQSMGDFGVLVFTDEMGIERRITDEVFPVGVRLGIKFEHLTGGELNTLTRFFTAVQSSASSFELENKFFDICPASLEATLRSACNFSRWRFVEPPIIEVVKEGVNKANFAIVSVKGEDSTITNGGETEPDFTDKLDSIPQDYIVEPVSNQVLIRDRTVSLITLYIEFTSDATSGVSGNRSLAGYPLIDWVPGFNLEVAYSGEIGITTAEAEFVQGDDLTVEFIFDFTRELETAEVEFIASTGMDAEYSEEVVQGGILISSTPGSAIGFNATYFVDTTSGNIDIQLPAGSNDRTLRFVDYAGSDPDSPTGFGLNRLKLTPDGTDKIQGVNELILDKENTAIYLTFFGNSWRIMSIVS